MEATLAIIKPDAVKLKQTGLIIQLIELNGFSIAQMRKMHITRQQAESFYAVHKDKPFFAELTGYLSSAPVIVMALEKENAVQDWRTLIGATNPANAAPGTIRKMFGISIGANTVHGSDSVENGAQEVAFFFAKK
jgi:nucleoside-diphosphate kinase